MRLILWIAGSQKTLGDLLARRFGKIPARRQKSRIHDTQRSPTKPAPNSLMKQLLVLSELTKYGVGLLQLQVK
ncbi:hypothetical protein BOTBODRAFT_488598 [Botryobasidium botryosum FD-172 SS1]|uniref:Uncharacterized protein n=1 Tax=Botryobasidium botryosum (strain FD-172 SS1) TaxID=930990 RepID=A0A067M4L4_BOTB1|nr:hypothetical protein BOTBODRAFT_488598 [Botryobasidium botryosum FD-172 SS1]